MAKPLHKPPSMERLRACLSYCPTAGEFRWRDRPDIREHLNARHRGQIAGCINHYGYRNITIDGVCYPASRLAWFYMTGGWPYNVDHKNLCRSDDKFDNLRPASNGQNQRNRTAMRRNKSGFKGVCWHKDSERWRAKITVDGQTTYLGNFLLIEDAAKAYAEAAPRLHGEFARVSR